MAEHNPHVIDENNEEKIVTESPPECTNKETKLELVENEGDSEKDNFSTKALFFIVTALMLCVFLVRASMRSTQRFIILNDSSFI